ncbi:MAG: asparagine synthase (glutamine-hydrolyzing) [Opitutales bacterium]|nr:asparagine synthase (glutamine-hydrolyzing) [Opitutales bacterium]
MCGIAGILNLSNRPVVNLQHSLATLNRLQKHRGPDGEGLWGHEKEHVGLAHVRLSIIDLETGQQPMHSSSKNTITYNGEIYNFEELKKEIGESHFSTNSDTEVILKAYERWGVDCISKFRGMFAFALWDESKSRLFCARDRFGIKPFYYTIVDGTFYCASEIKALLPFVKEIDTDKDSLNDYLTFQFTLGEKTLFKGIKQLEPGHLLTIEDSQISVKKYWEVYYNLDFSHTEEYFIEQIRELMGDSIRLHLRSDVPVGAYVSGGRDSSIVAALASQIESSEFQAFTGKFSFGEGYDESEYARDLSQQYSFNLHELDIKSTDFVSSIHKIIYHLDQPVAGPGSFPQYQISQLASEHRKVVLGGQGGDEIFGGYARYLIAYFEQCIKGAIEGSLNNGNFVVTYESIISNLESLKQYKPMLKQFWSKGLFETIDRRYFDLINRAPTLKDEVNWNAIGQSSTCDEFSRIFLGDNVGHESYFDLMTHFDFKTLLPALLQVEDRMSMAHGLESRVPFLDHKLIELAATIPADIKFKNGELKRLLVRTFDSILPNSITQRKDKMGFPVPLNEWMQGELKDFVCGIFETGRDRGREFFNTDVILENLSREGKFSRKIWGLLSLEVWMQEFHDKSSEYKKQLTQERLT